MALKLTNKELDLFAHADTMDEICASVSAGGTLPEYAELKGIRYGMLASWVQGDEQRRIAYNESTLMRGEWFEQSIYRELRGILNLDIRGALNEDGSVKPVSEWPDELAKAVSAIDFSEHTDKDGNVSASSKLKVLDKLKGIELLMKNRKMLSERVEHSGKVSLEALVESSRETPA